LTLSLLGLVATRPPVWERTIKSPMPRPPSKMPLRRRREARPRAGSSGHPRTSSTRRVGWQHSVRSGFFPLQKLPLQKHVDVRWPTFHIKCPAMLGLLSFKLPAFGVGLAWLVIPEECVFTARLLLSVALLVRMVYVGITSSDKNKEAPRYDSAAGIVRTVVLGVAAPTLLSALAIVIGASTGTKWLTGLGVVLFWPVIGYLVLAHVVRIQIWKSCRNKCVHQVIMCISRYRAFSQRSLF
jgi:hypothetical protein